MGAPGIRLVADVRAAQGLPIRGARFGRRALAALWGAFSILALSALALFTL